MEAELKNVNDQLKDNKLEKFATACDTAGTKMESFGKKMSVVSAGIAGIGAASIAAFKELDEGYDTIVTKTGATGEALEGLTKSADNVFGTMPEDMSTVGEAIGEVNTRFHTTGTELEKTSKQFIQFATINGTNVTQSVDQVDKIMKAWNVDASQTGNLLGLLTAKAQETGISVDTLESNVLDNNAAFKEMGLSLPQAINLMAQFDANGVDSTQAMAGLKKALQNATAEGKSMDEALSDTIGSIKNAKTETEAMQIATELFGKKGAAEMTKAIRENRIDLTSLSSSMEEYGTTVEDTYNGKRSVETTSGVERLQLRAAIEKLEEEVYELREMLLQSKLDAELLLEKDLKKKLKISKMCEQLLSSLENQYEQLNEEKRELRAVYDTKVNAVAAEDMEELIEERQAVRDEETHGARAELLAKYGEAFKDRFFDEAVEKVDCEIQGKVYVKREQAIESQEGAKLSPEQKSR